MQRDAHNAAEIVEAAHEIAERLSNTTYAEVVHDRVLMDSVIMQLIVLGEAARNLSDEMTAEFPEVPWVDIRAMRNRLVHSYRSTSPEIVWDTARIDVPTIGRLMQEWLDEHDPLDVAESEAD